MHPLGLFTPTNLVLLFHSVPPSNLFRSTIRTIKTIYKFISIEDIESYYYNNKNLDNCCHICFDDGSKSVYEYAFPVLQEMNIPASLFVSPKVINEESNYWFQDLSYIQCYLDNNVIKKTICEMFNCEYEQIKKYEVLNLFKCMNLRDIFLIINTVQKKYDITIKKKFNMTLDQLYELNDSNLITIGAHTLNHPILYNETTEGAKKEIVGSICELSRIINKNIKYFAYPNGKTGLDYCKREENILKENKIKLAFSTNNNFFNNKINPLDIPRSGFSGLAIENGIYVLGKIFFVPFWDIILNIVSMGKTEINERKKIKDLYIFK